MKITPKNIKKHQMGGQMLPAEEPMPEAPQTQDPVAILGELAMEAVQGKNCGAAMEVCKIVLEMLQQNQASQEPQGEPVFRKGGILVRRIKK